MKKKTKKLEFLLFYIIKHTQHTHTQLNAYFFIINRMHVYEIKLLF